MPREETLGRRRIVGVLVRSAFYSSREVFISVFQDLQAPD